jgi:hypothetical protein
VRRLGVGLAPHVNSATRRVINDPKQNARKRWLAVLGAALFAFGIGIDAGFLRFLTIARMRLYSCTTFEKIAWATYNQK